MELLKQLFDLWLIFLNHMIQSEIFMSIIWMFLLTCTLLFFIRFIKEIYR